MDFKQNFYELFGLPESFEVDVALLSDRYLELQKEIHPDRFASASDQEKRLSMQWTTQANTAFETLKNPLRRAIYLLELRGVTPADNPVLPPEFLMDQIELREELEDIEASSTEGEADLARLDGFNRSVKEVLVKIENEFSRSLDSNLDKAEQAVYEMQFLSKLLTAADQLEEKLLEY